MNRNVVGKLDFVRKNWYFFALVFIVFSFLFIFFRNSPIKAPKIKVSKTSDYLFEAKNAVFVAQIADSNSSRPSVSFASQVGGKITLQMEGTSDTKAEQQGEKVVFKNVNGNTDVSYSMLPNGLKEEIILNQVVDKAEFIFDVITLNAAPKKTLENTLSRFFYDSEGRYQFHLEKPFAVDAKGQRTDDVVMQIRASEEDGNKYQILIAVPVEWLKGNERAYPVTIDPTVVYAYDTQVEFAAGSLNRLKDTGTTNAPVLETYYQELTADQHTVALWHLNEASGNALDSSGNGNTGTPTGTSVVSGVMGNARSFSVNTDKVVVPDSALFTPKKTTIEFWVKLGATTANTLILGKSGEVWFTYSGTTWGCGTNKFGIMLNNSSTGWVCASSTTTPIIGQWYHLAATYDESSILLYINGNLEGGPVSFTAGVADGAGTFDIGAYTGGTSTIVNTLDEIRVSNTVRTDKEIKASASRRPYGAYTSDAIDFISLVDTWNPLLWTELGVNTGDGETLFDSTGLVAQWNFNETSGGGALNNAGICGASCHLALSTASTTSQDQTAGSGWTADNRRWGVGALSFNGISDNGSCIDPNCGGTGKLDFVSSTGWTASAWVKTSNAARQFIMAKGSSTGQYSWDLETGLNADGKPSFIFNNNVDTGYIYTTGPTPINDGQWHYLVGTYDGTTVKLYVDGKLENSSTAKTGTQVTNSTGSFYVGSRGASGFFNGTLDVLSVYSRALTQNEIISNYNSSNVEIQTRVGNTSTPNDGTWDSWMPLGNEVSINSFDSDSTNWPSTSPVFSASNNIIAKVEGSGSMEINTGPLAPSSTNFASGKTYTKSAEPHPTYSDTGNTELTDGLLSTGWGDGRSIGYYGAAITMVVDLSGNQNVSQVAVHYGTGTGSSVFYPISAKVYTSTDNTNFTYKGDLFCPPNIVTQSSSWCYVNFPLTSARYVKVSVEEQSVYKWVMWSELKVSGGDMFTVGHWQLNETGGTGAYIKDSSSNANHGTPTGTTSTNGILGKARFFNGSSDYITAPNSSSFDLGTSDFTFSFWAKHQVISSLNTYLEMGLYTAGVLIRQSSASSIEVYIQFATATDAYSFPFTPKVGQWYYFNLVRSGNILTMYVNGSPIGTAVSAQNIQVNSQLCFAMSCHSNAQKLNGYLDDISIRSAVTSPEEIAENYRIGRDRYITKSISTTDLSGKSSLPFYVAADRPGSYLTALAGETAFSNYQADSNTVALWHLDDQDNIYPRSCYALKKLGNNTDGIYYIDPDGDGGNAPLQVYCNMTYDGGGWTMAVKSWYGSGLIGKSAAVGAVTDATAQKGNAYKLSDQNIRNIIGPTNNFDVMADQNGYNTAYSTGNYEYVVIRNYTAPWTYEKLMPSSTTTTIFQSYRASDQALAWTGNIICGVGDGGYGRAGINCAGGWGVTNNPQGGAGCNINMGTASNVGWYHFFMNEYNDDTYLYICNGPQHSSGFAMNHRFWIRERAPVKAILENSANTPLSQNSYITATGGTITNVNGYTIHSFTSSGTFAVTSGSGTVEALVVAGGGGGANTGSGGGAGGYLYNGALAVTPQAYTVTVGNGGSGGGVYLPYNATGKKGENSVFSTLTAEGGGAGYSHGNCVGGAGGSGGGGPISTTCTATGGTATQGGAGGAGYLQASWIGGSGGGGGYSQAGTAGSNVAGSGNGGWGRVNGILGTQQYFSGGGGGGEVNGTYVGAGGIGGGGSAVLNAAGGSGTANTGGGGAGGAYTGSYLNGGSGGSGIVVIRYKNPYFQNLESTINGATLTQGKIGKARYFNGTSDYAQTSLAGLSASNTITIDYWAKANSGVSYMQAIQAQSDESTNRLNIHHNWNGIMYWDFGNISAGGRLSTSYDSASNDNKWVYWAFVSENGVGKKIYRDGKLIASDTTTSTFTPGEKILLIGKEATGQYFFKGVIDELRISSVARTSDEIRQAYEAGQRTHPITIDFGAKLDSGNLISDSEDLSFTVDATIFGLAQKGTSLYSGDKIVLKENYNGTEYIAQGSVSSVNASTGAVSVSTWDSGSTFPSVGFSVNASVFKWQREYWNISEPLDSHLNGITQLNFRLTDGNEGRTIYLDDLKSNSEYLTNPAGSTIQSATGKGYFQYRVIEHSSDESVSSSISNLTATAVVQIPYPPVFSSGSAVSSSSIVWTHTDASSNEDGFKLYDSLGNYLNFSNTANTTTITETGLSPDTVYNRKVASYNTYGTSYLSGIISARTLVNVPGAITVTRSNATTAVINTLNTSSNPSNTEYAIYLEVGITCDGSGGNYLATNGASNGSTAAWQTLASWTNVTISFLVPESEYVFCAKARNTALVETTFGPRSVNTGKIIPVSGDLTVDTNLNSASNFITRYKDGSDENRWIIGLDTIGVSSKNSSKVNLTTGSLTINSNETLVTGELNLQGGSIFIPTGGKLAIGSKLWAVDRDVDGYPDVTNGEVKLWYGESAPANTGLPQEYFRRKGLMSTLATTDCNDNDNTYTAICCESNGVACASDGACCSAVCATNTDGDAFFSSTAGHTGICKAPPALPYTDCNDALSGHSYTLPSATYYPDADLDTYTLAGVSSGTAICANAATWNTATEISIPGIASVNASFAQGTRKASASVTADCLDSDANIRTKNATGGTITNISGYRVHSFTSGSSTFTVTCGGTTSVEYLVVGGGASGGGSRSSWGGGGGGGAGGFLSGTLSATQNTGYGVTVGAGGAARAVESNLSGASGGNSSFSNITALGGGGGGQGGGPGQSVAVAGGSGGGAGMTPDFGPYWTWAGGAAGTAGQGYAGGAVCRSYAGAGGGGAVSVGEDVSKPGCTTWNSLGGNGGLGNSSAISGSTLTYSVGGHGGQSGYSVTNGATNTGNGGSGVYAQNGASGAGGSGVVIVRYANP